MIGRQFIKYKEHLRYIFKKKSYLYIENIFILCKN